ncbi:EscU/YscU/HrcU family type III secretion system export apparatus switch protein [Salmonella enterica]|nr:EscU/YscU/HrcU family type III secretion system export apparatus switch protein [Salmonella enterica]EHG4041475.1 EscU/YscU/HrcU family type III secretion system export apparatus switch protein [Salmonella enterica]
MANKTEKPTQKRLQDASKKGQILKNRDIVVTFIMFTGITYLVFFFDVRDMVDVIEGIFENNFEIDIWDYIRVLGLVWLKTVGPLFLVCAFTTIVLSLMQSRLRLATKALKLNFNALNPVNGLKRIFNIKTVKEFIKTVFYLIVIILDVMVFWNNKKNAFFSPLNGNVLSLFNTWGRLLFQLFVYVLSSFFIILVLDILTEYFIFMKDMKMDKEEVKREYKEQEGNPEFKSRRLEMHREILSEQIKSDISNSRLIIVNPTHIAIGIYFKPEISLIPVISFKAANAYALAVRKYAEKVKIPVIRDVKLARRIYATHKCYDYICLEELDAIFELLLWLEDVEKARVSVTCQVTGNMDDDSEILTAEIVDEEIIMNGTDSSDSSNKDY